MLNNLSIKDGKIVNALIRKCMSLAGDLDERGRRRWAACEAIASGYGWISAVSLATGPSEHTIRKGIREVESSSHLPSTLKRRIGAGRKPLEYHQPALVGAIDRLVEPTERGDPQSPLRCTCKSLSNLQVELLKKGFDVGRTKIGNILRSLGYSLHGNRKTRERDDHPDRNTVREHRQTCPSMPARRKASNFRRHKEKGNLWQQGECRQGVSPQGRSVTRGHA